VSSPAKYEVRIKASARRDMDSLPLDVHRRISNALLSLESAPRPRNCRRLRGRGGYRMRVADYRILYLVDDKSRTVEIMAVGNRKDVYR
jgi:mRNA interferase RelE/StbE